MKRLRNRMTGTVDLIEPSRCVSSNYRQHYRISTLFDENNKVISISYEII